MRSAIILLSILSFHKGDEWTSMFDRTSLDGWKATGNPGSWTVKDGAIRGEGSASLLVYQDEKCVNCEFRADVRINRGGTSAMFVRVGPDPGSAPGYEDRITEPGHSMPEDTWVNHDIIVEGNHVQVFLNGRKTVDYIDEKNAYTGGYLALQQSGAGSTVEFKNVMLKTLPGPSTALTGTWKLNREKSMSPAGGPPDTELRVLDERDGIRWQALGPDGKLDANFYGRPDGYDYRVNGTPLYDHISLEQTDKHQVHIAMRVAKVRKKLDPHTYLALMHEGRDQVGRIVYTISPDGKAMTAEGTWKHGAGDETHFSELFEKVD